MYTHDYYLTWSADVSNGLGWNVYPWASLPQPPNLAPVAPTALLHNRVFFAIPTPSFLPASGEFRISWSSDVRDGLGWDVYTRN